MPDSGRLIHMKTPEPSSVVRIETGVHQGDLVSVHYDPMISKLVVWGKNRTEALRIFRKALGDFQVVGPHTNIEFLKVLSSHKSFIDGDVDTGFIQVFFADFRDTKKIYFLLFHQLLHSLWVFKSLIPVQAALFLLSLEWNSSKNAVSDPYSPWCNNSLRAFRMNSSFSRVFKFKRSSDDSSLIDVRIQQSNFDGPLTVNVEGTSESFICSIESSGHDNLTAMIDHARTCSNIIQVGEKLHMFTNGKKEVVSIHLPSFAIAEGSSNEVSVSTPMPCKISIVQVKAGDAVKKGQTLFILEAMKMEVGIYFYFSMSLSLRLMG
jgi:3-methylcrotonyl-CoA carboxylase alpha subunit